eukprot:CAMPEP_0117551292 /NCGR_PEP_ID=MMETSP0784-20121206/49119_1 /TAXON_ID=39447 /ORGANISM="" /LENGTH=157 /DNA_ID=CAMNT_0005348333 /DNA_START=75 /DNA_END=545 /DNA_ORIENTATION=+
MADATTCKQHARRNGNIEKKIAMLQARRDKIDERIAALQARLSAEPKPARDPAEVFDAHVAKLREKLSVADPEKRTAILGRIRVRRKKLGEQIAKAESRLEAAGNNRKPKIENNLQTMRARFEVLGGLYDAEALKPLDFHPGNRQGDSSDSDASHTD